MKNKLLLLVLVLVFSSFSGSVRVFGGNTAGIDDDTVITVEQAGSIAVSSGDYGWDSRGAEIRYYSLRGDIEGNLGEIYFRDIDGKRHNGIWSGWGGEFPEWWTRQLAERIRSITPDSRIAGLRRAFSDSIIFDCEWMIAIGTKSSLVENNLYKTLRTDGTLRVAYGVDLDREYPQEKLFKGDEMATSLKSILPGQTWGSSSLATFAERNPYTYSVRINSYDIDIRATNCPLCAAAGLVSGSRRCTHVSNGTYFNIRLPIEYGNKSYSGERCFAWEGQTVKFTPPEYVGFERVPDGDDLSGLRGTLHGTELTPTGDSTILLYYEAIEEQEEESPEDDPVPPPAEPIQDGAGILVDYTNPAAEAAFKSEYFDVSVAIPSTESVYLYATASDYLCFLDATVISGIQPIHASVSIPYELRWREDDEIMTESGELTQTVTVQREYSYVHLNSFACSVLESITAGNSALNPSQIRMTATQAGVKQPSCSSPTIYGSGSPSFGGNIDWPNGFSGRVTAETLIIEGEDERPEIPVVSDEIIRGLAESAVGNLRCRNDELYFNGTNVLGRIGWHQYSGTETTNASVLRPHRIVMDSRKILGNDAISIPAEKRNAVYSANTGTVKYITVLRYGGAQTAYDPRIGLNPVRVHTPVLCKLKISECDNDVVNGSFNQEVVMKKADMQLVVGGSDSYGRIGHENDTCDFYLSIDNLGIHEIYSGKLGAAYDYYHNINGLNGGSYVAVNEVRFPFDVYMDTGNDRNMSNDRLISAGTWFSMGNSVYRFYLPEWVHEGDYVLEARSRAANALSRNDFSGYVMVNGKPYLNANTSSEDYVTADSVTVHVSAKIHGLSLYEVDSETEWQEVFKNKGEIDGTLLEVLPSGRVSEKDLGKYCFYYTVGTQNELGLSTGRSERFILPLLSGSTPVSQKQNTGMLKAGYIWKFRLQTTGSIMACTDSYIKIKPGFRWISGDDGETAKAEVYYRESFSGSGHELIRIGSSLDATNIHLADKGFDSGNGDDYEPACSYTYADVYIGKHLSAGDNPYRQYWYFEYSLPSELLVKVNDEVKEEGYLVISFEITSFDENGKPFLAYNTNNCCMWKIEGQQKTRKDFFGHNFEFEYGDTVILDLQSGKAKDYQSDHKY